MKSFYPMTRCHLLLLCLSVTAGFSTLTAQDTIATRMHEVGLQIFNFNLESFGVIYKKQKLNNPNRYTRYRFAATEIGYSSRNQLPSKDFRVNLSASIGNERRVDLNTRTQFLHGLQFGPSIRYQLSTTDDASNTQITKTQNLNYGLNIGYLVGIQYNLNEIFYLSVEIVPSVGVRREQTTNEQLNQKNTIAAFNAFFDFDSNAAALTLAYRFGVARK
jgi:hypothetical protein